MPPRLASPAIKPRSGLAYVASLGRFLGLLWLLAVGLAFSAGAAPGPDAAASAAATASPVVLRAYVSRGCPHCAEARRFLDRLSRERPELRVDYRVVDEDPQARDEHVALSYTLGIWPPGVPTFVLDGQVIVGYDDDAHTGRAIVELLESGSALPKQEVESRLFGTLSASRLGLPLFTLALGLLDGFNPCAMWVLLFLLSLLVRLNDRRRMALVAGTFVFVSGAVYYAFMAAWFNVFRAVGLSEAVRLLLAALALVIGAFNVKDFVAWGHGPSLSIPDRAKPGLVARMRRVMQAPALPASLLAVAALAVVVNFVELLCTAGLPAIYTAVLAQQSLSPTAHYAYLGLYIAGYITDDALMVGLAVAALGSGKLTERAGRWLKLVSGLVMLGLGLVLLLRPQWLV
ncbi:MAG: glutaredoxin family protein [Rubrivivax sp.]|nr:glutaredoxin family protein [Rubrivivax sp.]